MGYYHVPRPTPPNYIEGKKWDLYAQEYIQNRHRMPPEWGDEELNDPLVQLKTKVSYNSITDLVGVYDIYESKSRILYELKSGHSVSARGYSNTLQIPLYLLVAEIADIPVERAIIIRYNQRTNTRDRAIIYPSSRIIEKAKNYLDSITPEIYTYFETNGLFEKTDEEIVDILQKSTF